MPDIPGYAKSDCDAEHTLIPVGVQNSTLGYFSLTLVAQGTALARALGDGITEIITGRRPMGDWGQVVKDWQTNGGNQIRTELQRAIAAGE